MERMENVIITNMCMIYDDEGNILVQNRINKNWPGITFPGGHVERNESFIKSTIREVKEETGLDVWNLKLCGMKHFTDPIKNYRYIVLYYKTNCYKGELKSSIEGEVFWIKREDINKYKLADGFIDMLKVFDSEDLSENYYFYKDGKWFREDY